LEIAGLDRLLPLVLHVADVRARCLRGLHVDCALAPGARLAYDAAADCANPTSEVIDANAMDGWCVALVCRHVELCTAE
jgi:hypothetical protein